ncbi:hypothetical protein F4778DRAFT_595515 [Xylariomycetidae sp. FL2044]|nr:hypothetical protein F4778DRAFT_595515 [Xylariomycetidae sp. FL2044]
MATQMCTGSPTFNEAVSSHAFSEWPDHLPGYICKTPPMGYYSAPRFAQCCSGPVYNITSSTTADDPAYPVTCATLCQVDPAFDGTNDANPYGWSDYFMCLTDGGDEASNWEVVCATNSPAGTVAASSFTSTPTGDWMTRSYATDEWGRLVDATDDGSVKTSSSSSSSPAGSSTTATLPSSSTALPTGTQSRTQSPSVSSQSASSTPSATTSITTPNLAVVYKAPPKGIVASILILYLARIF